LSCPDACILTLFAFIVLFVEALAGTDEMTVCIVLRFDAEDVRSRGIPVRVSFWLVLESDEAIGSCFLALLP